VIFFNIFYLADNQGCTLLNSLKPWTVLGYRPAKKTKNE